MAMQIRPNYVNPLSMTADKKAAQKFGQPIAKDGGQADKITELQTKQQQLQNQILLLKSTGADSAGATTETQKAVQEELEKVTAALRSVKGNNIQAAEQTEQTHRTAQQPALVRRNMDFYESEKAEITFPGIYQIKKDSEQGYKIAFLPYSET